MYVDKNGNGVKREISEDLLLRMIGDDRSSTEQICGKKEAADGVGEWGLSGYPLAMVYSPIQNFQELHEPDKALERGTIFAELDFPFEGESVVRGGCGRG